MAIFSGLGIPMMYYSWKLSNYGRENAPKGYEWPTDISDVWRVPVLGVILYFIQV
jgi:hypothetical protein